MSARDFSWDDLRLFLAVARLGGLSAATSTTGASAATLGRRITVLEHQIGEPLFVRRQTGYELTSAGEALLQHAEEMEQSARAIARWRDGAVGDRIVRVSAGSWTSQFLSRNIGELWRVEDGIRLELVTAEARVDIGRRAADIGLRAMRPSEANLAGRLLGRVAYALYAGRHMVNGAAAGLFVGVVGEAAQTATARWLMAHHGDRIAVRGNSPAAVAELVAAGAGLSVFPCFAGDSNPSLLRVAAPIAELLQEQWLVTHQDDRHRPEVRLVADRIAALVQRHGALFRGELPRPREAGAATAS